MKGVQLIHNDKAGTTSYSQEELHSLLECNGYKCLYDLEEENFGGKFWKGTNFIVVAGGDGTIRSVVEMLQRKKEKLSDLPIAIIPQGSANNIAKSLDLNFNPENIIGSLEKHSIVPFDIGVIENIPEATFFVESCGFGVFPFLIKELLKQKAGEEETKQDKIQKALAFLEEIILTYPVVDCAFNVDGKHTEGKYLLAEIMNIKYLGANLCLSPFSNSSDGELELVLVDGNQRQKLKEYIVDKRKGIEAEPLFQVLKGKKISITWHGDDLHVDDRTVTLKRGTEVKMSVMPRAINFLAS